ncbi:MAG: phytanoyl-CoA dioxygenase family protein [candidate division Zixibacteria bacterium]|nr:phytanoyl-CoA dioxygenase family protein [candidate division Zixibacteria bacterium]
MSKPTDAEWKQWNEQGYLVFEEALSGDFLKRLQAAFDRCAEAGKEDFLQGIVRGETTATFYDIPGALEKDDVFIDLVDHPAYYGHLQAFTDGKVILLGPQVRMVPPWVLSYVGWHPDVGPTNPLHIKVQIYVNDVAPGAGEFAYVPGSHRPGAGPYPRVKNLEAMPGYKRFPGKAGTVILFNSYGWHAAMENHTGVPRKSIILIYEKYTEGRIKPETYVGIAGRLHTQERRRLFSLEAS